MVAFAVRLLLKLPNQRGGKLLSGPERIIFVTATIIYSSSPPLFWAPRFWESRDQPQPGFFLEARERTLETRAVKLYLNVGNDEYISLCNFGDRSISGLEVTEGNFRSLPPRSVAEVNSKKKRLV